MTTYNSLIFPDCAVFNSSYVNASYLFFDGLVSPQLGDPPSQEAYEQIVYLSSFDTTESEQIQFAQDFNTKKDLYAIYKQLSEKKIILPYNSDQTDHDHLIPNRAMHITNILKKNPIELGIFFEAARNCPFWINDGIGFSPTPKTDQDKRTFEEARLFFYCMRAIERIEWAKKNIHNIVAYSIPDYTSLKIILALVYNNNTTKVIRLVREFMQVAVPFLVAKNYDDLLELKYKLHQYLEPFRIEMRRLHSYIPESATVSESLRLMQDIVKKNVNPKISELEHYLKNTDRHILKHLVSSPSGLAKASATIIGFITALLNPESFFKAFAVGSALAFPLSHLMGSHIKAEFEEIEMKIDNPFTFAVLANNE